MNTPAPFLSRLFGLFDKKRRDDELAAELESHLQLEIEDNLRSGMSPGEARRQALLKAGGIESAKEQYRDRRGLPWIESVFRDLWFAGRSLRKSPGFTTVAVLTLALGIGANAGIFSVVEAALLRPLPYPDSRQLFLLFERGLTPTGGNYNVVSLANFHDWRAESKNFSSMAAVRQNRFNLGAYAQGLLPERIRGAIASWTLFPTLGIQPILGRNFTADDDRPEASLVAIISHRLWQRRFGGAPDITGLRLRLDGESYEVIGVMPPGCGFPARGVEVWLPVERFLDAEAIRNRGTHQFYVVARLGSGDAEQAAIELDTIQARIHTDYFGELVGKGATVAPLSGSGKSRGRTTLLVLFAAVGCLLLIACVNFANLLLARGARRQREMTVRAAMGAGRRRLLRQLLTESLLLSFMGAAAGLALAYGVVTSLGARTPAFLMPSDIETTGTIELSIPVFLFAAGIALLTGILAGFYPAWQAARTNPADGLRESARSLTTGRSQRRFRALLVTGEVALSLALLVAAGLLTKSFVELRKVDPGVRTDRLLTAGLSLPEVRYSSREKVATFARQLAERLDALPGVNSSGLISCLPVDGYCGDMSFSIEGRPFPPGEFALALNRSASPDYFAAAGIPLLEGRAFHPQERRSSVIISESMATRYWPDGDAIGHQLYFGDGDAPRFEIIGIVGDALIRLDDNPRPTMYFSMLEGLKTEFHAILRTPGDPAALAPAVREAIHALDPDVPAFEVRTMADLLDDSASRRHFTALLLGSFAALALLLAAVGLYGVMSYTVASRTNEIAIRVALGATRSGVRQLLLLDGLRPTLAGIAAGVLGAWAAGRLLGTLLFDVSPTDPATFLTAIAVLVSVGVIACLIPAHRASRLEPTAALRND